METPGHLLKQLRRYRDLLANFSRRNRELYFKESRTSSVNLTSMPEVESKFRDLLTQGFTSLKLNSKALTNLFQGGRMSLSDHFLLSETQNEKLVKKLEKTMQLDAKFQREYGISGAWLLGPFLCWRSKSGFDEGDLLITPIFKVAVDLERNKQKRWALQLEESSLSLNPTLVLAMDQFWGIKLDQDIDASDPLAALKKIAEIFNASGKIISTDLKFQLVPKTPTRLKIIKNDDGDIIDRIPIPLSEALNAEDLALYQHVTDTQFVIIDTFYLDQLNASRAVLLSDYDQIMSERIPHPILAELFLGVPVKDDRSQSREKLKALDAYKERQNYFVVDIDSTQHRAVARSSESRTTVIQGPPGTGKSQTITNLIAENIAKGKRVLFVAEKRAALDVVYSRLKLAKLDSQCALIHTSDLNRQELYSGFLNVAKTAPDATVNRTWERVSADLDEKKIRRNTIFNTLESVHQPSQLAVAEVIAMSANVRGNSSKHSVRGLEKFALVSYDTLEKSFDRISELQTLCSKVPNYHSHLWKTRNVDIVYSASFVERVKLMAANIYGHEKIRQEQFEKAKGYGLDPLKQINIEDLRSAIENHPAFEQIGLEFHRLYGDDLFARSLRDRLNGALKTIEDNWVHYTAIKPGTPLEAVIALSEYYGRQRSIADWFTPHYWEMRKQRNAVCLNWTGSNEVFTGYQKVTEAILDIKAAILETKISCDLNFNSPADIHRCLSLVFQCMSWIDKVRAVSADLGSDFANKVIEQSGLGYTSVLVFMRSVCDIVSGLNSTVKVLVSAYKDVSAMFRLPLPFDPSHNNDNLLNRLLAEVNDLEALDVIDARRAVLEKDIDDLNSLEFLEDLSRQNVEDWVSLCRSHVVEAWTESAKQQFPQLRGFDSSIAENDRQKFVEQEAMHREMAREYVNNTLSVRWNGGKGEDAALRLLTKETTKQKKILSPREIMEKGALNAMMKLKPCWLMSPLSISQILPIQTGLFDLIIFDEASQVRVEDAIPSIFRANAMVVVGDQKQMPPTNFFSSSDRDESEDEDDEELADSILDLAVRVYPAEMLEWHYRSRSEALIAFSNRAFYGGRLIAPPNPRRLTEGEALKFIPISDGIFLGQKEGNAAEAQAVISQLAQIFIDFPDASVGVIAMGQSQVIALEEASESRASKDKQYAEMLARARDKMVDGADVGFFIKNLENVQGDERDIILISVGYGPSKAGKKVALNFGPLSKKGGARRLNVAITRAKMMMRVYCSFAPEAIPMDDDGFAKNPDLAVFGRFLSYAKAVSERNESAAVSLLNSFGVGGSITSRKRSKFSQDVERRLRERGFDVSAEIGSCGFFVDLAIHHPVIPSNFILGIECDGDLFHSTPYARDRDKIRQQLLESRGWQIARVWSSDWARDWGGEMDRLETIIQSAFGDLKRSAS